MKLIKSIKSKKGEVQWYIVGAILALVLILIGFFLIKSFSQGQMSVLDKLKELI